MSAQVKIGKPKGRVFVYTSMKELVPGERLREFEIQKDSKQVREEEKLFLHEGLVSPPFPPESFLELQQSNVYFDRCVCRIAEDVAGRGLRLVLAEGKEEIEEEKKAIQQFLAKPNKNPNESIRGIIQACVEDLEVVGWMGMEAVRSLDGLVNEVYHVPAHTLRVHKSRKKYRQERGQSKVWFKAFGVKEDINKDTGKQEKGLDEKTRANELIYYKHYYARSDYYGRPPILGAVGSVLALIGIRDYNLAFFENYGVPAAIIVLEGDWEPGSDQKLREFLDTEIRRTENAHKTMVLVTPEGCKATWIPLVTEVKEAAFKIYLKILRDEVLVAYSMPGYRIGLSETGSLGGSTAEESTKIYISSVIDSLQLTMEEILNQILKEKGLVNYRVEFIDLDVRNIDAEVDRFEKLFGMGAITPNDIRNRLDLGDPYDLGNQYYVDNRYIPVGGAELEKADQFSIALNELRRTARAILDERKTS